MTPPIRTLELHWHESAQGRNPLGIPSQGAHTLTYLLHTSLMGGSEALSKHKLIREQNKVLESFSVQFCRSNGNLSVELNEML